MRRWHLFLILAILLFAWFVWPTRYQSLPPGQGPFGNTLSTSAKTRVDRITGDVEVQDPAGRWRRVGNRKAMAPTPAARGAPPAPSRPKALPSDAANPTRGTGGGFEKVDQAKREMEQMDAAVKALPEKNTP